MGLLPAAGAAAAQAPSAARAPEVLVLWPRGAPGAPSPLPPEANVAREGAGPRDRLITHIANPTLTVHRPAQPNGAAIVVAQGGGYVRIAQSGGVADYLTSAGFHAFELLYRLPGDGWAAGPDAPLQDVQRALRLVRNGAVRWGLDPARIGVLGFSAGAHVASSAATRFDARTYAPIDAADTLSARPDFACLSAPVITMRAPYAHGGSKKALFGPAPSDADVDIRSNERNVTAQSPPMFLVQAADDATVPAENSLHLFQALRAAKVPAELHLFQEGGHGFGMRPARELPISAWPDLMLAWLKRNGFSAPRPTQG
jgi:acetyl esterase/lipase